WGLLIPLMIYFLGPQFAANIGTAPGQWSWPAMAERIWRDIVRPIAVGGMMVGAAYTLFRMRNSLGTGLGRAFAEMRGTVRGTAEVGRLGRYMSSRVVLAGIGLVYIGMLIVYTYLSGSIVAGVVSATAMLIVGFCFATVSG